MIEINLESMGLLELKALNVRIQREINRRRYIELERRIVNSNSIGLMFELRSLKTSIYYPYIRPEDLSRFLDNLEAKTDKVLETINEQ